MTSALRWGVGGQHHVPAALPPGKTRYPLYRRLDRPQGRSGRMRKISLPPGFDPRTVQPVASRYTDCAIPAHTMHGTCSIKLYRNVRSSCFWNLDLHSWHDGLSRRFKFCFWLQTYRPQWWCDPKLPYIWTQIFTLVYHIVIKWNYSSLQQPLSVTHCDTWTAHNPSVKFYDCSQGPCRQGWVID